jgi:hypothetical protein
MPVKITPTSTSVPSPLRTLGTGTSSGMRTPGTGTSPGVRTLGTTGATNLPTIGTSAPYHNVKITPTSSVGPAPSTTFLPHGHAAAPYPAVSGLTHAQQVMGGTGPGGAPFWQRGQQHIAPQHGGIWSFGATPGSGFGHQH